MHEPSCSPLSRWERDGVDGTLRRIRTAVRTVQRFGIGTECGLGRRDPATIPALLAIHCKASDRGATLAAA